MFEETLLTLTAILLTGVACQWLAWWLKLPAILLLLLAGILAGPITGLLDPDALFGDLLFPMVSLGVAVILFEGSLSLRLHQVAGLGHVVRNLITVGAVTGWVVMAAGAHWLTGLSWQLAFLFGATVVVSGPTVIMPLLRTMRPKEEVGNLLRWEGILIDPIGALLAVLVFEFIISGQQGDTLFTFAAILASGGLIGAAGAWLVATLLRRHLLPDFLNDVTTLALVLGTFTLANHLAEESGLLAVTVMGMMLANMKDVPVEEILDFKEKLSILLISLLFILLAARLDLTPILALGGNALALLGVVMLIARPITVAVSTLRSRLSWRERTLLAGVAPRGIVAAAVSALFALRLDAQGVAGAELLVPLTFMIIIGTVVVHSITARPLARLLDLAEPEPRGVLIIGAHPVGRAIATTLCENGFRAVVADTHWEDIRQARMAGLLTYFGNPVSEHADRNLSLVGVGHLFAMSPRPALNALACARYRGEFGADSVYGLRMPEEKEAPEERLIARPYACTPLFGKEITLTKLASLLSQGGEIRATPLSESFDFDAYLHRQHAIPLFARDPRGNLRVFTGADTVRPEAGWRVIGLLPAETVADEQKETHAARRKETEKEAGGQ